MSCKKNFAKLFLLFFSVYSYSIIIWLIIGIARYKIKFYTSFKFNSNTP
ncbi:MAG: hypothetical protein UY92_C0014G0041 [Candidatus Magasanikbacteria bacterium GW2011_GWA2_56_11]|uniref:Uncharacterized protein n=1 Tax=Candidatus Magasanikbacteria bacterium GW2011_GWA2_56_11 TaxID=1619044 RepID=A0A0G1YES3_9BACT|nr:MAG: hypothetical protein UY92_C0014G0041 [Candidatus Magasanikbacteria bacterium GW2011_GWA2_56_11]